ncbi:hypothetical protein [Paenibacillus amylolyticus]|nr:hypothetical protein [Paenibacillus amylolyticus]
MKQLLLEGFTLVFGGDYVIALLVSGITFVVAVISLLAILKAWGRYA